MIALSYLRDQLFTTFLQAAQATIVNRLYTALIYNTLLLTEVIILHFALSTNWPQEAEDGEDGAEVDQTVRILIH
jgi:hypothetical protein